MLAKHRDALGYRCLSKRFIRSGEGETGTRGEVKISGVMCRDILAARQGLQVCIRPEALGLDPYWQRPKKAQVFGNLLLGNSLTLAIRDEDVVGDFICPDFLYDGVVGYQFLENPATVRGIRSEEHTSELQSPMYL